MDIQEYQERASQTDQVPGSDLKSMIVPLLGLAGEAGSLLTEYKKLLRDGDAYKVFDERIAEELGDILWYVAAIATKANLSLSEIALENLTKIYDRWKTVSNERGVPLNASQRFFDEGLASSEQLPRTFEVSLTETMAGDAVKVVLTMDGEQIGDHLTDNSYTDDGYRFHDVFHLSYATILGWSPVTRKLMRRKRKSDPRVDEVEDGGRAAAIEEAICALVFDYARKHSFLKSVEAVDYSLLKTIKDLTSHLEVQRCSTREWESAILEGFSAWRSTREHGGGVIKADLLSRSISCSPLQRSYRESTMVASV